MNVKVFASSKSWLLVAVAASVLVTACGSNPTKKNTQRQPDWIVNEPNQSGHVYGVGSAPVYVDQAKALQQAQDAARVSMIQKLKVTVTGTFSQDTQETRQTGKETQLIKTLRNQISSTIPQAELDNLNVQENYVDANNKVAYSLVHLDRRKASANLRRRISELDMQVTDLSAKVPNSLTTLKQLQALMPALSWMEQRDKLAEQLVLVDMNNRGAQRDEMTLAVDERIKQLFDALTVTLTPNNTEAKSIRSGLANSLTGLGLRISNGSGDLNFYYTAKLRSVSKGGRYVVFADGQVQIKDPSGRILSEFSQEAKGVSAASSEQAEYKAVTQLGGKLGAELTQTLISKID